MASRILITGINGFIGRAFARRQERPGWEVWGTDCSAHSEVIPAERYLPIDLADPRARARLVELPEMDWILHAGGVSGFMVETDFPERIFEINVAGTMPILELAREKRCRRLVLCSTAMVYGPEKRDRDLTEDDYAMPMSVYGASKVAVEGLMSGYVGQFGIDAIALRFTHVYGPGRTTQCFVRDMLLSAAAGEVCRVGHASGSLRQYVHIADVCDSIERAFTAERVQSRVFNISAGENHTLGEVADIVREVVGELEVEFNEEVDLPNYRIGRLSIERAARELGYIPQFDLRRGVRAFWNDIRSNRRSGPVSRPK
jgi:UDP-glucuronate 4-epimerase